MKAPVGPFIARAAGGRRCRQRASAEGRRRHGPAGVRGDTGPAGVMAVFATGPKIPSPARPGPMGSEPGPARSPLLANMSKPSPARPVKNSNLVIVLVYCYNKHD